MEWLNYHHLFYFWTVMREGSLTAASNRLSLAPSTISAQLSRLEETLGGQGCHDEVARSHGHDPAHPAKIRDQLGVRFIIDVS